MRTTGSECAAGLSRSDSRLCCPEPPATKTWLREGPLRQLRKGSPSHVSQGTGGPAQALSGALCTSGRHLKPQADSSVARNRHRQWNLFPPSWLCSPCSPKELCPWASTAQQCQFQQLWCNCSSTATCRDQLWEMSSVSVRPDRRPRCRLKVLQMTQGLSSGRGCSTATQRKHSQSLLPWEDVLDPRQKCQAALQGLAPVRVPGATSA